MTETHRRGDALGIYLTGGAANGSPASSLGGAVSVYEARGMGAIIDTAVQGLKIDFISPACGEGSASIAISGNNATFTPPSGGAGSAVAIAAGETKVLEGATADKFIRVTRVSGETFTGTCEMTFVTVLNGIFSGGNVEDTERQAGETYYRAAMLKAHGDYGVTDIRIWCSEDGQAAVSLAVETPVAGEIQEIADETTAPIGLSWVTATSEGTALTIASVDVGDMVGLWIRKTFPALGIVNIDEPLNITMKYKGA